MTMAAFIRGKPIMQPYDTGGVQVNAGDVVVIGNLACVAHESIPAFSGGTTYDSLSVRGGIYGMTADQAYYPLGTYVYWDPTGQKVTASAGANAVPFGWIVGGVNDQLSDAAGTAVSVAHDPSDDCGQVLCTGAVANDNITNTSAETAFATTAVIPAGSIVPGDTIHVRAAGIVNAQNSTNTNNIKLKISTALNTFTTVLTTGATNVAANGVFIIDGDLVFTAVGNSGSLYATGDVGFGAQGTANRSVAALGATAINTNLACTIEVTDTQSVANTGNVTQLLELVVQKLRK